MKVNKLAKFISTTLYSLTMMILGFVAVGLVLLGSAVVIFVMGHWSIALAGVLFVAAWWGRQRDEAKKENGVSLSSGQFEYLCSAVHDAWWKEKIAQGVTDHPNMIPYADLTKNVKDYDRATVRRVLDALGLPVRAEREGNSDESQ